MEEALLPEGLRERKRRETSRRIAETGLKLFLKNGYENTTLDEIAAAAGISRPNLLLLLQNEGSDLAGLCRWRFRAIDTPGASFAINRFNSF